MFALIRGFRLSDIHSTQTNVSWRRQNASVCLWYFLNHLCYSDCVGFSICRNTSEQSWIHVGGRGVFKNVRVPACLQGLNIFHVDRIVNNNKKDPDNEIFWPLLTWTDFYQLLNIYLKLLHSNLKERSEHWSVSLSQWLNMASVWKY